MDDLADAHASALARALEAAADPERGAQMRAYMKTERPVWGLRMAEVDAIVKQILTEVPAEVEATIDVANAAWSHENWLMRMAASKALLRRLRLLKRDPDAAVVCLTAMLEDAEGWADTDLLAISVLGPVLEPHPVRLETLLDDWVSHPHLWVRRASLITPIKAFAKGRGDVEAFGRRAERLLPEAEWFLRKATGWTLREIAKHRPEWTRAWVEAHPDLSGLARREAMKHLS